MRTAILTISTSAAAGETEDVSGPELARLARDAGCEIVASEVLPDERSAIEGRLRAHAGDGVAFVFTTGGTGATPDDVTPEATLAVVERNVPGIAEAMRAESRAHTPLGILTRGVAGIAGRTLIVNFPGNPRAIGELWPVIAPTLRHLADQLSRESGRGGHAP